MFIINNISIMTGGAGWGQEIMSRRTLKACAGGEGGVWCAHRCVYARSYTCMRVGVAFYSHAIEGIHSIFTYIK